MAGALSISMPAFFIDNILSRKLLLIPGDIRIYQNDSGVFSLTVIQFPG